MRKLAIGRLGSRWVGLSILAVLLGSLPVVAAPAAARDVITGGGTRFSAQDRVSTVRTLSAVARTGQLKIAKSFQTNGYPGTPSFAITYQCVGTSGTVSLKAGGSKTITGVRPGNCKVTEKALTNPSGWTYATPAYSPAQTVAVVAGKTATVTVNNTITRNPGSLQITKTFEANGYGADPAFEIDYTCAGVSGTVLLKGGGTATIPGVPPGDCTLTEKQLSDPPGWVYATPAYSPARTVAVVSGKTAAVTVANAISRRSPQIDTVFNYPGSGAPDLAISNELVRRLDQVPAGAQVEAAFYIITPDYPVVDALIAAHDRGASVQVVLDSGDRLAQSGNDLVDATFQRLRDELGADTSAGSFAMQCEVAACISQEDDSIQHNKFVLMSASGDQADVVFQTTSNMRTAGSGDSSWNAAVVSSGNAGLFGSYRDYFADLAARLNVPGDNYHAVRPPVTYGKFTPYYFPRTDGIDTVAQRLGSVDCATGPAVDVMATHLVRTEVGQALGQMAQGGCAVRVLARTDNITPAMCQSLQAQGVVVRIGDAPSATKVGIHAKYLTISGGTNGEHLVWMGSHNLTINALLRNDETFVMIDDQSVHDAFQDNFQTIWAGPSLTPGCDRAADPS